MEKIIKSWPGKSPAMQGQVSHSAVYHMLDVAAVAEHLIANVQLPDPVKRALVLLVALHDLGKINAAFRAMLERGQPQTAGSHWEVTEALLRQHDKYKHTLARTLGGRDTRRYALYAATAGHHGRPPQRNLEFNRSGTSPGGEWKAMLDAAGPEAVADADKVIDAFCTLWPDASIDSFEKAGLPALTWRLAGLVTAADWIGSNPAWFPPSDEPRPLEDYLREARINAAKAIATAGLDTPGVADGTLFDFTLRPSQRACHELSLPDGPMLAILEDETGSGKTEAALILARRMLAAGKARGLYFALPTMATANSMFARVANVLLKLYASAPSLALAHGRAALSDHFRSLKDAHALNPDEPGPTDWLADNRRRALLADVGVGTIDQALLGIVKAKHSALRLFGLSSKILIVDEVHEVSDPYMGELVAELLHAHAALGGSAILLSATLPLGLREKLVKAFEEGAGRKVSMASSRAYPSLTVPGVVAPAIKSNPSARGPVAVERLDKSDDAVSLLTRAAAEGAACVFVRNAVDEAIAAVTALRAKGVCADLLHARFALVDRKRHEAGALEFFGKGREPRPGRVLVATQVVESSLDLDFDVMVSDLAPMAALIQRAGRLWRHMDLRPAATRPSSGPTLHVVSPDPALVQNKQWAEPVLGQGAWVYPAPILWRTARVLFEAGSIVAPDNLRDLIEAVEDPSLAIPPALESADIRRDGEAGAARSHARQNVIDWSEGYRLGAKGADDADYPTRLGQPQKALVLARSEAGKLVPWSGGEWCVETCQLSEVQASAHRLLRLSLPDQKAPEIAAILGRLPEWLKKTRHICPVNEEGHICAGLNYCANTGLVFAHNQ